MPEIKETTLETALAVLEKLPEFDALKPFDHYREIMEGEKNLVLTAFEDGETIGCKIGYDRFHDGSFYSWLGGVIPNYRKSGVAKTLADYQENWAMENGFTSIKFKTQNRHKAMLQFALRNGFSIYRVIPKSELTHYRIELIKPLI